MLKLSKLMQMAYATKKWSFHNSLQSGIASKNCSSSSTDLVVTEKLGKVFLIGLNRPEVKNCVNLATAQQLAAAVEQLENDDSVGVGVLYGKGGTFCAGFDLTSLSKGDVAEDFAQQMSKGLGPMGPSRRFIKKPLIAAVEGYAVAGGLELALMCDLRVMEDTAVMGVFCRRFGVPLLDGGTVRLPRLIGLSRALDLILTGRPISGKECLEFGLANRVVATGTAVGQAVNLANNLLKFPQLCMNRDRESAYHATFSSSSLEEAFDFELQNSMDVVAKESVQGASRFVSGVGRGGSFNISDRKSKL